MTKPHTGRKDYTVEWNYVRSLTAHYLTNDLLNENSAPVFENFLNAALSAELDELIQILSTFKEKPEDGLHALVPAAFALDRIINDAAISYDTDQRHFFLRALTKIGVHQNFSKFTGEETTLVTLSLDGPEATRAIKFCKDDRWRPAGQGNAHSGPIQPGEALIAIARNIRQGIAFRMRQTNWSEFQGMSGPAQKLLDAIQSRYLAIVQKRSLEAEMHAVKAASSTGISYLIWRFQNRNKLEYYGL